MKKIFNLLLTVVMLCTILVGFTVLAMAAPTWDYSITDSDQYSNHVTVYNGNGLKYVLENFPDPSKTVYITINTEGDSIDLAPTVITGGGHIVIDALADYSIWLNSTSTTQPMIRIDSDNTILTLGALHISGKNNDGDCGVLYVNGDNCIINSEKVASFNNCYSKNDGGAIYVNGNDCTIWDFDFWNCKAGDDGGGIYVAFWADCQILDCYFNSCECDLEGGVKSYGSDIMSFDSNAKIGGCESDSEDKDHFFHCVNMSDEAYRELIEKLPERINADNRPEPAIAPYSQPNMSDYARGTMAQNKYCDVIRPYLSDEVTSELGYFTLNGTTDYGMGWMIDYENPLTITAEEGDTITRIDAILTGGDENYENLIVDAGTKCELYDNPYDFSNSIAKEQIVQIDDINSDSVTLTVNGDLNNYGTMHITDIVVYFSNGANQALLGSALSGGSLAIVTAVAGLAVGFVVGFAINKKSMKENAATIEKIEEEDE